MSESKRTWRHKLKDRVRHAFSLESPHGPLTDEDHALLNKLAAAIVRRRMGLPAVLLLQSIRPLNALGNQAMMFLRPFLSALFKKGNYDRMTDILDRREGIAALLEAVEAEIAKERAK